MHASSKEAVLVSLIFASYLCSSMRCFNTVGDTNTYFHCGKNTYHNNFILQTLQYLTCCRCINQMRFSLHFCNALGDSYLIRIKIFFIFHPCFISNRNACDNINVVSSTQKL